MQSGILTGAALVLSGVVAWKVLQASNYRMRRLIGMGVLVAVVAGTAIKLVVDQGNQALSVSAPVTGSADVQQVAATGTARQSMQVGSVSSLVTGLEQRLQEEPDDVKGWALLAQSYAFVGQAELAEEAITRAVALGMDEAGLRQRVASAMRESPESEVLPDSAGR